MEYYSRVAEILAESSKPFTREELIQLAQPFIVGPIDFEVATEVLSQASFESLVAMHGKPLANRIKRDRRESGTWR